MTIWQKRKLLEIIAQAYRLHERLADLECELMGDSASMEKWRIPNIEQMIEETDNAICCVGEAISGLDGVAENLLSIMK